MKKLTIEVIIDDNEKNASATIRWVDEQGVEWSVPNPEDVYSSSWDRLVELLHEVAYIDGKCWQFFEECSVSKFCTRIARIPHVRVVR